MVANGTGPVEALGGVAFWWNVKHEGISSNEPLERPGAQVKLNNVVPLGQQSPPADLGSVVACAGSQGVRASRVCL